MKRNGIYVIGRRRRGGGLSGTVACSSIWWTFFLFDLVAVNRPLALLSMSISFSHGPIRANSIHRLVWPGFVGLICLLGPIKSYKIGQLLVWPEWLTQLVSSASSFKLLFVAEWVEFLIPCLWSSISVRVQSWATTTLTEQLPPCGRTNEWRFDFGSGSLQT